MSKSQYQEAHGYYGVECSGMHLSVEGHAGVFLSYEDYDLLRRNAEKWARDATEEFGQRHTFCQSCNVEIVGSNGIRLHAHDCDAAHILGLERVSER